MPRLPRPRIARRTRARSSRPERRLLTGHPDHYLPVRLQRDATLRARLGLFLGAAGKVPGCGRVLRPRGQTGRIDPMAQTKADRQAAAKKGAATRQRNKVKTQSQSRGKRAASTRQGRAAADQAKRAAGSAVGGVKKAAKSAGGAAKSAGKSAASRAGARKK